MQKIKSFLVSLWKKVVAHRTTLYVCLACILVGAILGAGVESGRENHNLDRRLVALEKLCAGTNAQVTTLGQRYSDLDATVKRLGDDHSGNTEILKNLGNILKKYESGSVKQR